MPASVPARQVHLGNKKVRFMVKNVQREYAAPIAHDPPAAVTCHARVAIVTSLCLYAATPLPAGGFNEQCGTFEMRFDFRPDPI